MLINGEELDTWISSSLVAKGETMASGNTDSDGADDT